MEDPEVAQHTGATVAFEGQLRFQKPAGAGWVAWSSEDPDLGTIFFQTENEAHDLAKFCVSSRFEKQSGQRCGL